MNSSYYVDTVDTSYGISETAGIFGAIFGLGAFIWIAFMAICILQIIAMWKIFVKAGKPGWASIIPIYNTYVMCQIAEKEWWYILLMCIPLVNFFAMFVVYDGIAKKFGKSTGFTIGMMFLPFIFFMILGFGKDSVMSDNDTTQDTVDSTNIINEQTTAITNTVSSSSEPVTPVMEATPIMSEPVAPVIEESTVEPQVQQEVQMPSEQPHTSLWSNNNNTNNG